MDECNHLDVQSWKFEDGQPALFWSCKCCGHKFVPLDLKQEQDAKRYRFLRDGRHWPAVFYGHDTPDPLIGKELDSTVDERMKDNNR